jgi:hypothetical protein
MGCPVWATTGDGDNDNVEQQQQPPPEERVRWSHTGTIYPDDPRNPVDGWRSMAIADLVRDIAEHQARIVPIVPLTQFPVSFPRFEGPSMHSVIAREPPPPPPQARMKALIVYRPTNGGVGGMRRTDVVCAIDDLITPALCDLGMHVWTATTGTFAERTNNGDPSTLLLREMPECRVSGQVEELVGKGFDVVVLRIHTYLEGEEPPMTDFGALGDGHAFICDTPLCKVQADAAHISAVVCAMLEP